MAYLSLFRDRAVSGCSGLIELPILSKLRSSAMVARPPHTSAVPTANVSSRYAGDARSFAVAAQPLSPDGGNFYVSWPS